jgi:hypothetical protein
MRLCFMADGDEPADVGADGGSTRTAETLSQFVAGVLDQLSLSAWLPSAALVLLITFVVQLGAALDTAKPPDDPLDAVGDAFAAIAATSVGGALMLAAGAIVLTMLTQAFSLAAIQMLEGYWGTNRLVEWVALRRCNHFRRRRKRLHRRLEKLTEQAVDKAIRKIQRKQDKAIALGGDVDFTPQMLAVLRARVLKQQITLVLAKKETARVNDMFRRWSDYAPADLQRRRLNLQHRLLDFPKPRRMLPTRLGNVLRRYEDETRQEDVPSMVQRVYDSLPGSLQVEHDELRIRLDLYCSMVVVIAVVSLFATARLSVSVWYSLGAAVAGAVAIWIAYRAAIANARAYGRALVRISEYVGAEP